MTLAFCCSDGLVLIKVDQILHILAEIAIDDPVEELEEEKGDRKNDAAELVQAGR